MVEVDPLLVLEHLGDPLFVVTRAGRILFLNKAARELAALSPAGEEGSGCLLFCGRETSAAECGEDCLITQAIVQQKVIRAMRGDFPGADPGGGAEEIVASPLAESPGREAVVLLQIRKVHELLFLEKARSGWLAAQQKHEALEQLFIQVKRAKDEWTMTMDGVSDLVLLVDGAGQMQRCNKAVRDFLGKPYAEILGRGWEALFVEAGMRPMRPQGAPADVSQCERFHEPSSRFFQQACYPPEAENGELRHVVTLQDISDRKRILLKVEQDRKKLEGALAEISSMIQRVTNGNAEEEFFFPLPPDHEPCWKMMRCGQENCPCFGREPRQCWTIAGTSCKGKVQGKFAQKISNCLACEFYQEAADDPVVRIGIQFSHMVRIIEKKNRELQDAFDELKAAQSQFVQQEKMASIGQLAAGVAHEINNPIGFVTSNLGTLQKYLGRVAEFLQRQTELFPPAADDDRALRLAEIRRQLKIAPILEDLPALVAESLDGVERVRKIVQNLKSFSRVDQSDYSLADINQCLDDTLNIIWNELKYKCTVKKEYGDLPPTRCYPQQLNQVFMNLLVNAAQAIENKGEIVITTKASETEITIAIADSGSGIPPENLGRIFEPFFTTKEVGKGTGLGLSITYDIVTKKHGGRIEVASEPGQGTTFVVTLPVKTE
jgi:signal transduction histidine kinase/PAS domain-containing protein